MKRTWHLDTINSTYRIRIPTTPFLNTCRGLMVPFGRDACTMEEVRSKYALTRPGMSDSKILLATYDADSVNTIKSATLKTQMGTTTRNGACSLVSSPSQPTWRTLFHISCTWYQWTHFTPLPIDNFVKIAPIAPILVLSRKNARNVFSSQEKTRVFCQRNNCVFFSIVSAPIMLHTPLTHVVYMFQEQPLIRMITLLTVYRFYVASTSCGWKILSRLRTSMR